MNAAQAVALPGDRRQNRTGRRPAGPRPTLYLVPAAPETPGRETPGRETPAREAQAPKAPGPVTVTGRAAAPPYGPLRLTRRGRVVAAAAAALLITAMTLIAAAAAQAAGHQVPRRAGQGLIQVAVHPGQTLWSVAESADPDQDPRLVVQRIIDLNGLGGDVIQPGELLWVPRS